MDFYDSLSGVFRVWQIVCISPFSLKNLQSAEESENDRRVHVAIAILIQISFAVLSCIFANELMLPEANQAVRTVDLITLLMVHFCALVIFLESYVNRHKQQECLRKINSIDFTLEFKVGIKIDYPTWKRIYTRRMILWFSLSGFIYCELVTASSILFINVSKWWLMFLPSFFICTMRYLQIITYVNIVHHRYQLINEFISNIGRENESNDQSKPYIELKEITNNLTIITRRKCNSYEKLNDIRRICRFLGSVSRNINGMFQISLPILIANDFLDILDNLFWNLTAILSGGSPFYISLLSVCWPIMNFFHITSISNACHQATEQVFT